MRAGDVHAGDRRRALPQRAGDTEPIENRQRSRIHRVAAQLVAGKPRAIDEPHADAGPREHECRDAAGRPRADDQDVGCVICAARPSVSGSPEHQRAVLGAEPEAVAERGIDGRGDAACSE